MVVYMCYSQLVVLVLDGAFLNTIIQYKVHVGVKPS